jgi:hypothetical protein
MVAALRSRWLRPGAALTLLIVPAATQGAVFPCSLAGIDAAVEAGGGPHGLACTSADTILVPRTRLVRITGDLVLDFGDVTLDFESFSRPGLHVGPTVDYSPSGCVRGATAVHLSHFTLKGQVVIGTSGAFAPAGSAHATIEQAVIASPPSKPGGIHVSGPNSSLHLTESTLDGNRYGIQVGVGAHAEIDRSLIANTVENSLGASGFRVG